MDGGSAHCATEPADKVSGFRTKVLPQRPEGTTNKKTKNNGGSLTPPVKWEWRKKEIDSHLMHRSEDWIQFD